MDEDEIKRERRRQRALDRLGTNHPVCVHCGEDDWRCLERLHIGGDDNDDLGVIECRNCHRKLSDRQKDWLPNKSGQQHSLEKLSCVLDGLADFFQELIVKLRQFARELRDFVREEAKTNTQE